ncbi:MAG: D-glycerate dehydrogenase [Deltaproteobacteria bacterium]|nr:D-glycerate dehydrogenase [Deltaproteobacteria bacterium]
MAEIFISRNIFTEAVELLESARHVVSIHESDEILPTEELILRARGKEGLMCLLNDRIDERVIEALPSLKIISNIAVGYDNIDLDAASRRGIMVTNTPGVLTETTADFAFSLMLAVARKVVEADRYVRAGNFQRWEFMPPLMGLDVHGKTLGIVGFGRIGQAVARRALGFNMKVVYYSRSPHREAERQLAATFVPLDELLAVSDFVTLHVPLNKNTRHMLSTAEFSKMKSEAILINTARGQVVNEEALVRALEHGEIGGTGLDVFEEEPAVHPRLMSLNNRVVLAPHLGSATRETRLKMALLAAENMLQGLQGNKPPNLVNKV